MSFFSVLDESRTRHRRESIVKAMQVIPSELFARPGFIVCEYTNRCDVELMTRGELVAKVAAMGNVAASTTEQQFWRETLSSLSANPDKLPVLAVGPIDFALELVGP